MSSRREVGKKKTCVGCGVDVTPDLLIDVSESEDEIKSTRTATNQRVLAGLCWTCNHLSRSAFREVYP